MFVLATSLVSARISEYLFWHAPLGVRSAIQRHQRPQRKVLGQVDCFVQCEVVDSQIALDGVQPRDTRTPWWSLQLIRWGAVRIRFSSGNRQTQTDRQTDTLIAVPHTSTLAQPGGHGLPRNWVHEKIPGCAVQLNTQNCAWLAAKYP